MAQQINPLTALAQLNRPRPTMAAPPIIPAQSPSAVGINAGAPFQAQQNFANSLVRQQQEELAKMALQKQDQGAALHMQRLTNENADALRQSADRDARARLVIADENARALATQKAKTAFDNSKLLIEAEISQKEAARKAAFAENQKLLRPQGEVVGRHLQNFEKWETGGDIKWQEAARNHYLMVLANSPTFRQRMEGRYAADQGSPTFLARPTELRDPKTGLPSPDYLATIGQEVTDAELEDIAQKVQKQSTAIRKELSDKARFASETMKTTGVVPVYPTAGPGGAPLVGGAPTGVGYGMNTVPGLPPIPPDFGKGPTPSQNLLTLQKDVDDAQREVDERPEGFMGRLGQNLLAPFKAVAQPVGEIVEALGIDVGAAASAGAGLLGGRAGWRTITDFKEQTAATKNLETLEKAERTPPKAKSPFNKTVTYTPPGTGAVATTIKSGNIPINELTDNKLSEKMAKANNKLATKLKVEMPKFDADLDSHRTVRGKIYEKAKGNIQKTLDKKWGTRLKEIVIKKPSTGKRGKVSKMLGSAATRTVAVGGIGLSWWALADAITNAKEKEALVKDLKEAESEHNKVHRMEVEQWIIEAKDYLATTKGMTPAEIQQIEARITEQQNSLGTPLVPSP